jgi:hypothetical protein
MNGTALRARLATAAVCAIAALALALAPSAAAAGGEAGVAWRLEQPRPPAPPPGVPGSSVPIGLGSIGDIAFAEANGAPLANRGLLISAGNPPTIPAGVWAYNGLEWHQIAIVCGSGAGRIAWSGPSEFWTVSDGRPGQTNEQGEQVSVAQLVAKTLCHFAGGQVVGSYGHPLNEADSYQTMDAAACFEPSDCWFAGGTLPVGQVGAFQLHWNGSSLEAEPYLGEEYPVQAMAISGERLYAGVQISSQSSKPLNPGFSEPPAIHTINPAEVEPTQGVEPGVPLYGPQERPEALGALQFSSAEGALWGAAGPVPSDSPESGQLTVVRHSEAGWSQLIGPARPLAPILPGDEEEEKELLRGHAAEARVTAIAAEPGTDSAWIALGPPNGGGTRAVLVRVSGEGKVLEEQTVPSNGQISEGVTPKGEAATISCPQLDDCWLATTQGWLFHLAPEGQRSLAKDAHESEYFTGLITNRPEDLGLPQVPPDAPPPDDSGLVEEAPDYGGTFAELAASAPAALAKVALPLLSHMHSRLVHGTTLELRFHLAVEARVRLVAERRKKVVAATQDRTYKAGDRTLLLRLNPHRWPTKLNLQTRALAPLPLVSSVTGEGANVTTEETGLRAMPRVGPFDSPFGDSGSLP